MLELFLFWSLKFLKILEFHVTKCTWALSLLFVCFSFLQNAAQDISTTFYISPIIHDLLTKETFLMYLKQLCVLFFLVNRSRIFCSPFVLALSNLVSFCLFPTVAYFTIEKYFFWKNFEKYSFFFSFLVKNIFWFVLFDHTSAFLLSNHLWWFVSMPILSLKFTKYFNLNFCNQLFELLIFFV